MSKDIYKQHESAFSNVSAYVITDKAGSRVATLAFKFPKDGAGRLYAYFHLLGHEMIRDYAGGYGYDKKSAAVNHAISKLENTYYISTQEHTYEIKKFNQEQKRIDELKAAFDKIGGKDWNDVFRDLGYNVLQAV